MKKCVIFAGAEVSDISQISFDDDTFVICADGGYDNAVKFEIVPDMAIGDFDTIDSGKIKGCDIRIYPPEKDDTDTMIAVKTALEMGYNEIVITGALGGRLDHTIANIQTLMYITEHNAHGTIIGDSDIATVQKNSQHIYDRIDGYTFSMFSMISCSDGITTSGLKYNLENGFLENTFPLGVSNEIIGKNCKVEVKNGVLLIIFSKDTNL